MAWQVFTRGETKDLILHEFFILEQMLTVLGVLDASPGSRDGGRVRLGCPGYREMR